MINKTYTVSEHLYHKNIVEIQTNISEKGLPTFEISGLVSKSVEEAKKRVIISLENSGFQFPLKNILVNIAPASISKSGTHYDLAIAVSIIKDKILIPFEKSVFIGELSFDGEVRTVENIFYLVISAIEIGFKHVYVPKESVSNLISFDDVNIYSVSSLKDLLNLHSIKPETFGESSREEIKNTLTYPYIKGNIQGKKAISYSLIGNHSIYIQGFPGVGKSMLAKSMADLAPNLDKKELITVSKIYSYSNILRSEGVHVPPFRSPHQLSSYSSLFGSFNSKLIVGEVSLAHKGILFLDEFPEFNRLVIEGLRIPMENKEIQLSRSGMKTTLPCEFILIAASNPCKCGYFNHHKVICKCSPLEIKRYQSRISGPILDRFDIKLNLYEDNINQHYGDINYPLLEYNNLKHHIQDKKLLRKNLLKVEDIDKISINYLCKIITQKYIPNKISNILNNELKNLSISERTRYKIINLIFTICLFNNRDQISIEDVFEGLNLSQKFGN